MSQRKYYLIFSLLLFFSCNSDDSNNNNNSEILTDFFEPPLNFLISRAEFISQNGEPTNTIGVALYYDSNQNGEIERIFDFDNENFSNTYFLSNVNFRKNQDNFDFILNWLTNKYGEPVLEEDDASNQFYTWDNTNTDSDYTINLVASMDLQNPNSLLFVSYNYNLIN